ncbi:MAG TPA: hypothetical protein VGG03_19880 [Thermoanaerobaculia bacterium]|jgi:hypothetical protein
MSTKETEWLKPERVEEMLAALPGWRLAAGGRAIERVKGGVQVTLAVPAGCDGAPGGLTMSVIELARQIG